MSRGMWLLLVYTVAQSLFHAATDWKPLWWVFLAVNAWLFMLIASELKNPEADE